MESALSLSLSWEGHRVRMVGTTGCPAWVAKDVCRALQIHHSADALRNAGVTAEERGSIQLDTLGGPQILTTVGESGLWKLVMTSRKPNALRFRAWLAEEVIPCIRKHGCYPAPVETSALLVDLRDQRVLAGVALQLTQLVAELTPKAESHDRLSAANGDVSLMDAGRILGRQPLKFIALLESEGVLFRGAHGKHEPAHEHRERGRFRVRITEVDGETYLQTLVTPSGLQWLAKRYPITDRLPLLPPSDVLTH